MLTALIRQHIARVTSDPQAASALEQRLRELLGQQGQTPSDADLAAIVGQLSRYVHGTPDLLDACAGAANQAGVAQIVFPLLEQAGQYFLQPLDSIPDHLGLYGLLDDAYLAQTLLARISALHAQHAGVPLLPVSLEGANAIVRSVIGEPIASQLDAAVATTVQGAVVQASLAQLQGHGGGLGLAGGGSATGGPGSWGGSWEDEMSRIGAECGISINW